MSVKVHDLELSEELKPVWGNEGYEGLYTLVRYHGRPFGWAYTANPYQQVISTSRLREAIAEQLGWKLVSAVLGKQIIAERTDSMPLWPISIVVCTRDRTDQLEGCLDALLGLDYPDYEIIIVDNAPRSEDTTRLAARLSVRYVREDRPGLDWARNRGIAVARHSIIAFTDDDARPDRGWLRAIACAFAEPEVMAVTGLIAPAELETTAQMRFEFQYGGMVQELRRRTIKREALTARELLWASTFGAGANMAFRRELFAAIGLFDVALDVGTPSGGAGDVEMFHRLVARGYTLVYEPSVLVWHTHRRDAAALRRLIFNNGRSFGTYLLTCIRNGTMSKFSILRFAAREWLGWWMLRRLFRPGGLPRHLVVLELVGALLSPLIYKATQARAKKVAAAHHEQEPEADGSIAQRAFPG